MYDNQKIIKICFNAIETYGAESQVDKAIEEMSELTKALLKERRYGGSNVDVCEEIADVFIMILQMMLIFEEKDEVAKYVDYKIKRLEKRITRGTDDE